MQASDGTCTLPQQSVKSLGRRQDVFLQALWAQWFRALLKEVMNAKANSSPHHPGGRGGMGAQTQEMVS